MADVTLDISKGCKGLSFVIDDKLEKELDKDVSLNAVQWQTIFDYITEDQAEQQGGQNTFNAQKDKDVNNGRHYMVRQGVYIIKEAVWNKILDFVKPLVGIVEPPKTEKTQTTEVKSSSETAPVQDAEIKAEIAGWLEEAGIRAPYIKSSRFNFDAIRRYRALRNLNKDIDLKTKIIDFATAWKLHVFEQESIKGKNKGSLSDGCDETTSAEDLSKKYDKLADQYISFYDSDNNGEISTEEMIYHELIDHLLYTEGYTRKDAILKAKEVVEKYVKGELKPNEDGTDDEKFIAGIVNQVEFLDIGTSTGEDGNLSKDEIKAYLYALSRTIDDDHKITSKEVHKFQEGIESEDETSINLLEEAYKKINLEDD